jgi:hypothetical protein
LSDQESEAVQAGAAALGMTVPSFLVARALEPLQAVAVPGQQIAPTQLRAIVAELYALKRIFRGAATNINQHARAANVTHEVQPEIDHHVRRLGETLPRFEQFVDELKQWLPS